ncbi:alternative ribosome rescue aminoacyl-tRNA hydrolase ArfB [Litorimonas sp. WD9-15]|uniref:alternative ribosome rescue aminoacyl-tRNA hydrolase ArfB n=1 Tax=Litorimonas sp. WD9-15 TaxID=3418716 RepID=UPI003CFE1259
MDDPLYIDKRFSVPSYAIETSAIRSSGPGGQSVNKTNSAIQLRCDLNSFHIPETYRRRINNFRDSRITQDGVVVIKAQNHRSQNRNLEDAVRRLKSLLKKAIYVELPRKKTRPSWSSKKRSIKAAKRRSEIKSLRGRVKDW